MTSIPETACFRLGVLGAQITQDFSARIAHLGLTHKQVGILALIDATTSSQRDLATKLGVAPSLVVTLVDRLVELQAVTRNRSETDRRVHEIHLTSHGKKLLTQAESIAAELDADVYARLSPAGRSALTTVIAELDPHW